MANSSYMWHANTIRRNNYLPHHIQYNAKNVNEVFVIGLRGAQVREVIMNWLDRVVVLFRYSS